MGEPLIHIPRPEDLPGEFKERTLVKPHLMEVNPEDIPYPLGFQVVILPVAIPTQTESGFQLVADTIRHMNLSRRIGVVLAIGPLAFSIKRGFPEGYSPVNVGDWVFFHENAGVDATMVGKNGEMVAIKFIPEVEILGKPRNPKAHMVMV